MIAPIYKDGKTTLQNQLLHLGNNMQKKDIDEFYNRTEERFRTILKRGLDTLQDYRFCNWCYEYMVGNAEEVHAVDLNEENTWIKAENLALQDLTNWCREHNKHYQFNKISDVMFRPNYIRQKFFEFCRHQMEELAGWTIAFKKIKVNFVKENMENIMEKTAKEIADTGLILNRNITNSLNRSLIKKNMPELLSSFDLFYGAEFLEKLEKSSDQIYNQAILTEHLVSIE